MIDDKVPKARSRRVLSTGPSLALELGYLPRVDEFSNLENSPNSQLLGFMEAFSRRCDQLPTPSPASLPSLQKVGLGCKFHASLHGSVFLVNSLHPEIHRESLHQNKTYSKCSCHVRIYKSFQALYQGCGQRLNVKTRDVLCGFITQKITRLCAGHQVQITSLC